MELNYCVNLYSFLMMRNNKLELKIGFDQVRESLKVMCLSDGGRSFVERMEFVTSYNKVIELLGITEEFRQIFITNEVFPSDNYFDMRGELQRLKLLGTFISQESLFDLKSSLITINECLLFFSRSDDNKFPLLSALSQGVYVDKNLLNICAKLLDSKGDFNDDASEYLYIIRSNHRKKVLDVDKQIKRILNQVKKEGWSSEEAEVTVRNGRLVIPISSANKKRIKGFIHDESQSGQTSYIEPAEIVELNNEIRELELEERREILKILVEFTDVLRPEIDNLINAYYFLSKIDFIRAKAKYALQIKAGKPIVEDNTLINWFEARHPILEEALEKNSKKIVPLRIELNSKDRILIISGPNAGGKSITLKTVGLLQIMLQSGLLIPVHPNSKICFFQQVLSDIGDNQSIENHLSTYSYRLKQMSYFLKNADDKTLLLVDEFGTGSDPELGGALAEVFFEEFYERNSFGVFTTHYTNIKLSAESLPEAINACMLFDKKTLEPLYRLEIGQAGSSFTFEVAEKNKIPFRLINRAKKKVESEKVSLDKTILKLQQEKFEIQKTKDHVEELRETNIEHNEKLEQTNEKIQQKLYDFQQLYDREQKRLKLGERISDMADSYLKTKNKKQMISNFLKLIEMENSKKTKEVQQLKKIEKIVEKEVKRELKENSETISQQKEVIEKKEKAATQKKIDALKVGDRVKIHGSSSVGTIDKIKKEIVFVNYGLFTTQINVNEVNKI